MRWPVHGDFWVGVNLPWLDHGADFGSNRWRPSGGVGQPDRRTALRQVLGRLADRGIPTVRWFMFADGRAGLRESQAGDVLGLDDCVFRDKGRWLIENHGFDPDILLDNDPASASAGKDAQLDRAVEVLLKQIKEKPFSWPPVPKYPIR